MEQDVQITTVPVDVGPKHQLAIVVLGAIAGFVAGKAVEKTYVGTLGRIKAHNANA